MLGQAFPKCRDQIELFLAAEMHCLFEARCHLCLHLRIMLAGGSIAN
jgi:hypothetical protein